MNVDLPPKGDPPEPEPGKHRRSDVWGPREVIALVVIVGAFALAAVTLIYGETRRATIPAWVAALVAGIGVFYYKNGKR